MTFRQIQAVLKIIERERRRALRDQMAVTFIATRAEPDVVQKMLKA